MTAEQATDTSVIDPPASDLNEASTLRALSAGWTTAQDRAFLVPILNWAFAAMLDGPVIQAPHNEGDDPLAYAAVFFGKHLVDRFNTATDKVSPARVTDLTAPTFAKHFVTSGQELFNSAPARTRSAMIRAHVDFGFQVLTAVEKSIIRAAIDDGDHLVEPVRHGKSTGPVATEDKAAQDLIVCQLKFLADLHAALRFNRLEAASNRIQARRSLERSDEPPIALHPGMGEIMFEEADDTREIRFAVERYPMTAEVLDPRVVRIPPGKFNNRHKHAHETLFYFISGAGRILVGDTWVPVKQGDAVFSPRWAIHQTHNTGSEELVLLAITDYYLTNQVYIGRYDKI
ncbi:Cupin domain-containing protein [Variovorax sp. HW608]|uniref:cupin domain-containing protein n=1 Tax=Variovorax sp. HW608 TaxID=1034889 RepID=UPI00081FFF60|nr:cupin domain-containing protein [Variovorax sp. HW608]SCK23170.1 Cupin domain-containing protein [Variovorax sp. HW608]